MLDKLKLDKSDKKNATAGSATLASDSFAIYAKAASRSTESTVSGYVMDGPTYYETGIDTSSGTGSNAAGYFTVAA